MTIKKNLKKKLFKILFLKKKKLIETENKTFTSKQIFNDFLNIVYYLKKSKFKIIELSIKDKYLFFLVLLGGLFSNKLIYPKKNPLIFFRKSLKIFDEKKLSKVLNRKILTKPKFSFNNSSFLILETTGTTSKKKLITLNSLEYLNACYHSKEIFNYNNSNKILHCLPIYYNAGLNNTLFAGLLGESKIIFTENFNNFNFIKIFKIAKKKKINSIQLMPNMFLNLYFGLKDINFIKSLRSIISTGSYLYPEIQKKFYDLFGKKIFSCYGITELGGAISVQNNMNYNQENCVGKIPKNIKVKINKKKEILLNTPFKMSGYFFNRKVKKLKKNTFFNSGDLGFLKKDHLYITGRSKEIVIRGGENISLKFIENTALKFDEIKNVVCYGIKNIYSGENLIMIVEHKFKKKFPKKNFFNYLNKSLDKNSLPSLIYYKKKFPYFSNGKVNRQKLINSIEI